MPRLANPELPSELAAIVQGLSISRPALAILVALRDGQPASFSDVTRRAGVSTATASKQLAQLELAGFVHGSIPREDRQGRRPVTWRIDHAAIDGALAALHDKIGPLPRA